MNNRTFRIHDTTLHVSVQSGRQRENWGWQEEDWETFNRLMHALEACGFTFGKDPWIAERWPSLNKSHRLGSRATPAGTLFVKAESTPTGCSFEFFQEQVTENRNGGRWDFGKREKMPYLIGKAYEVAIRRATAPLVERGFDFTPNRGRLDPADYFGGRYADGPGGWPSTEQLQGCSWRLTDRGGRLIVTGEDRLFRDYDGRIRRGRCYGGINGMWLVRFGPGRSELRQLSSSELFDGNPAEMPRREIPLRKAIQRLTGLRDRAVKAEDFEAAIRYRNALRRLQPAEQVAA
ncbi:hypothetical protein HNP52_000311 [Sphingomonas kyeonggiensis]|uniref:UVR domain-containing protein n=1 Tax=Sphingomonas kyeonggiensis TaxID=1268553 RepID=A0A7W7NPM3_9SPHN|nr:UvrB/UvrC motif-containing protein [Sphingomonas kyeonggiensis]MBB4837260.1 hypothetical protein [Sphingomonas kyeonggiensis]